MFRSQNKWYQSPGNTQSKEGVRSNLRPEEQYVMPKKGMTEKPNIGKGRVGLRRKPEPDHINQPLDVTRRISRGSKIITRKQTVHSIQMACVTEE